MKNWIAVAILGASVAAVGCCKSQPVLVTVEAPKDVIPVSYTGCTRASFNAATDPGGSILESHELLSCDQGLLEVQTKTHFAIGQP